MYTLILSMKMRASFKEGQEFVFPFPAIKSWFFHFGALKTIVFSEILGSEIASRCVSLGLDNEFDTPWPLVCTTSASGPSKVPTLNRVRHFGGSSERRYRSDENLKGRGCPIWWAGVILKWNALRFPTSLTKGGQNFLAPDRGARTP